MAFSDQLNLLINDQSHCDILLMHLIKKYYGPQGVLNLLSERHRHCWKDFSFFVSLQEKLKVCTMKTIVATYMYSTYLHQYYNLT